MQYTMILHHKKQEKALLSYLRGRQVYIEFSYQITMFQRILIYECINDHGLEGKYHSRSIIQRLALLISSSVTAQNLELIPSTSQRHNLLPWSPC